MWKRFWITHTVLLAGIVVATSVTAAERAAAGNSTGQLIVEQVQWGFDGTVVQQQFNLCSIRISNTLPIPWEGAFELHRRLGGKVQGVSLQLPVSLGPNETRWVQFVPFVPDALDNWELRWGEREAESYPISAAPVGPAATVLIYDADATTPPGGFLRRMPEELFPQSITAMGPLRGIILTHAPFWTGARVRTLREWLEQGGRIYLLHDQNGEYPVFPESMKFLNGDRTVEAVGRGRVKRIPRQIREIDLDFARREMFQDDLSPAQRGARVELTDDIGSSSRYVGWTRHEFAFRELRLLASFRRPWLLIGLAVLGYLLLFPIAARVGTEQTRIRWFYVTFLGGVLLFSLIFWGLGQLGASERNKIRSVGIARYLGDGVYLTSRWMLVGARDEGDFPLELPGSGWLLAANEEGLDQRLTTGRFDLLEGRALLEMPSASTTPLLARERVASPATIPRVLAVEGSGVRLDTIQVDPGPEFAREVYSAWLVRDQLLYPLNTSQPIWTLARQQQVHSVVGLLTAERQAQLPLWAWMSPQLIINFPGFWAWGEQVEEQTESAARQRLEPLLVAKAYGLTTSLDVRKLQLPPGMIRLLIHRRQLAEFSHNRDVFPDEQGSLLYVFDFPDPQSPPGRP